MQASTPQSSPAPKSDAFQLSQKAWDQLVKDKDKLGLPNLKIRRLDAFLDDAERHAPTEDERALIIRQARILLGKFYPHLPFKQDLFENVDPVARLDSIDRSFRSLGVNDFHILMHEAFANVRDPHTTYTLPSFYQDTVAFLPFRVGFYIENGRRRYLVTSIMATNDEGTFDHPFFRPGVEIVEWMGMPIDRAVTQAAVLTPGANESAQFLRGALRLTVQPLASSGAIQWRPPYENIFTAFAYVTPEDGVRRDLGFLWGAGSGFGLGRDLPQAAFSMTRELCDSQYASAVLWNREYSYAIRNSWTSSPADPAKLSQVPDVFEFRFAEGGEFTSLAVDLRSAKKPDGKFGYIRIRKFTSSKVFPEQLIPEFARLLALANEEAPDGLILDIRGNPGGEITAAEAMLQMLTPNTIEPARFHLANTEATLDVLRKLSSSGLADPTIARWLPDSSGTPLPRGPRLTSGKVLTLRANDTGQIYQGPVALLTDALTYSAADIFSGGFQDNGVGSVIGLDASTGGGGASVWSHSDLVRNLPDIGLGLEPLPGGASMSLAILRSSRVGPNLDQPIEDVGVRSDLIAPRTRGDLLEQTADVIRFACDHLADQPVFRIAFTQTPVLAEDGVHLTVKTTGIDTWRIFLDDHGVLAGPVRESETAPYPAGLSINDPPLHLRIEGFAANSGSPDGRRVAVTTFTFPAPEPIIV